jgi:hypothetical protein
MQICEGQLYPATLYECRTVQGQMWRLWKLTQPVPSMYMQAGHHTKHKNVLKNAVSWDVMPCDSCKTAFLHSMLQLLVTDNIVPSVLILVNIMMEAIESSETSVLTTATWCNILEESILHSHSHENIKSYIASTGWVLQRRHNVSPVKYEMGFYIPKDGILHSHHRDNLKSYIALIGCIL